ncbi:MAG TPA: AMP-binding protein, partial [Blastocatellia bacterium]
MNSTSRPERAATKFAAQDRQSSIARILRAHAERTPGRIAFSFLSGRTKQQTDLTFGSLDRDAARIAGFLRGRGVTEREPIALTFPPGLEFIRALFGCLYAGAIAVPTTDPYRRTRTATRLNSILSDVGPRFGLTVDAIAPKVNEQLWPEHRRIQWFATNLMDSPDPPHEIPDVAADSPALLQYTSGSTASPKGVVLTHRNLIANQLSIAETARQTSESVFVGWLPPYHDMGLIGLILHPVYLGARSVLMSTFEFLQRPFRWLEAISQFRGTASAAPNFAYDLCVDRISDADASALALDSIEVLINGAEPVRPETVERFERKFAA